MNPDSQLIEKILAGDAASFGDIVRAHQEKVLRLCLSILGPSQAEDAAQEVFLRVYESLDQFRGASALSTWIYRIAANHCLNLIAKKKREKTDSIQAITEQYGENHPFLTEKINSEKLLENRQFVQTALAQMSPEERAILTLREMEGLSYDELAETLELSLDLVKVRLFRARQSFLKIAQKLL